MVPSTQEVLYNYENLPNDLIFDSCWLYQNGQFQYLTTNQTLEPISKTSYEDFGSDKTIKQGPIITVSNIEIIIGADVESAKDKTIAVRNLSGSD
jgi:hypothetical protein